ncbi:MAG TPA: hypothetical protein VJP78_06345 [Thermoleophilia bacterium]|nr:hypothetical protein [Thermoleophilia bacterium]
MSHTKFERRTLSLILAALLSLACGGLQIGATPTPVPAHPAGEAVEVGGWQTAHTWLVGSALRIEPSGEDQAGGWLVTVVSAGACAPAPAAAGQEFRCVGLRIENTAPSPGALDLAGTGPMLIGPEGATYAVSGVRLRGSDPFVVANQRGVSHSSGVRCAFSVPDAEGRQRADCESILSADSNGPGFEEALVAVGGGETIEPEISFHVPVGVSEWTLGWPDGVRFELP